MNKKGGTFVAGTLLAFNLAVQGYNFYEADDPSKWLAAVEVSPPINSESYFTLGFYNLHDIPVAEAQDWTVSSGHIH
jgi:hypothetical protein